MLNFGPCSVTHNNVSLGDTFGGVSLKVVTAKRYPVGRYDMEEFVVGGEGSLNLYSYGVSQTFADSTSMLGFAEVVLDGGDRYKVTLKSCKVMFDLDSLEVGENKQQAFKAKLIFRPDASGNVIKIE